MRIREFSCLLLGAATGLKINWPDKLTPYNVHDAFHLCMKSNISSVKFYKIRFFILNF